MAIKRPLVISAGSIIELPTGDTLPITAADVTNVAAGNVAATNLQSAINELDAEKNPYSSGFVNRTDTTLAFDAGTRVFTLTKVNNFAVYAGGKKYDYTASQTTTIANSTGLHFIYIDTDGTLKNGTSVWDIGAGAQAPVATVYYNTTGPATIGPFDERHSYLRNALAHAVLHNTVGAYWQSGYAGTFGDTNGSISITAGTYYDEDIAHVSSGTLTQARLVYRSSGAWVADALNADIRETVAGVLQYDNAGTLTNVTNNNYVNYWVFAINTPTPEIHVVVGQTLFTSSATAIAEAVTALTLPPWITAEGKLIYRITYQRTAGTPDGDIFQTPTDFRTLRLTGGSTTGNVTNGDAHDHLGGDGAQIAHSSLSEIGTNTHAQIDGHLSSTSNPHSVTATQVLPSQTGHSGKSLLTNGSTAAWTSIEHVIWTPEGSAIEIWGLCSDARGTSASGTFQDYLVLTPWIIHNTMTLDRLGFTLRTAAAGGLGEMGIYSSTDNLPSTLLVAGGIDFSTTGFKTITISTVLTPGVYWTAIIRNTEALNAAANGSLNTTRLYNNSGTPVTSFLNSTPSATLPLSVPTLTSTSNTTVPQLAFRRSA